MAPASPGFNPDVDLNAATTGVTAGEAIKLALAGTVDRLFEEQAKVRLTADVHSVHQARVATRRLRSDLSTFGALFEPGSVDALRAELAWMGEQVLGSVRDADILTSRLAADATKTGAAADPTSNELVTERISRERGRAQLELLGALDGERCGHRAELARGHCQGSAIFRGCSSPRGCIPPFDRRSTVDQMRRRRGPARP